MVKLLLLSPLILILAVCWPHMAGVVFFVWAVDYLVFG